MTSVTERISLLQVKYLQFGFGYGETVLNTYFSHRPSSFPAAITDNFTGGHFVKISARSL